MAFHCPIPTQPCFVSIYLKTPCLIFSLFINTHLADVSAMTQAYPELTKHLSSLAGTLSFLALRSSR